MPLHRPCLLRALAATGVLAMAAPLVAQTDYPLSPDSQRQAGVPSGTVTAHRLESQVFPGTVRDTAIIGKPQDSALANVVFGGPELDTLYVAAEDRIYRRVVRRRGVFPWQVVTLPRPQL